jgi:hypothetical protein
MPVIKKTGYTTADCPVPMKRVFAALANGEFEPFDGNDRLAFAGAGPDARRWFLNDHVMVIACTDENDNLAIEVYDNNNCERVWQAQASFN